MQQALWDILFFAVTRFLSSFRERLQPNVLTKMLRVLRTTGWDRHLKGPGSQILLFGLSSQSVVGTRSRFGFGLVHGTHFTKEVKDKVEKWYKTLVQVALQNFIAYFEESKPELPELFHDMATLVWTTRFV
jgi:hypothetical protein